MDNFIKKHESILKLLMIIIISIELISLIFVIIYGLSLKICLSDYEIITITVSVIGVVVTSIYVFLTNSQLKSSEKIGNETIISNRVINCFSKIYFHKDYLTITEVKKATDKFLDNILIEKNNKKVISANKKYLRLVFKIRDMNGMPMSSVKVSKVRICYDYENEKYKETIEYNVEDKKCFFSNFLTKDEEIEEGCYLFGCIIESNHRTEKILALTSFKIILNAIVRNSLGVDSDGEYSVVIEKADDKYKVNNQYHVYGHISYKTDKIIMRN
jgi:hypothetical protein